MQSQAKFSILKLTVLFLLLVAFCGSIFFVFNNQRNNAQININSQNQISSQTSNNSEDNLSSQMLLGEDDEANAGDDEAHAGLGYETPIIYARCVNNENSDRLTATIRIWWQYEEGLSLHSKTSTFNISTDGFSSDSAGTSANLMHNTQDFKVEDVYNVTAGYKVSSMGSNAVANPVIGTSYDVNIDDVEITVYFSYITYTVRLHANNGSDDYMDMSTCTYGSTYNFAQNPYTNGDKIFAGWRTSGGLVYGEGTSFANLTTTDGAVVDLYALWVNKLTFDAEFDDGYGSGGPSILYTKDNKFYTDLTCQNELQNANEVGGKYYYIYSVPTHPGYNTVDGYYNSTGTQMLATYEEGTSGQKVIKFNCDDMLAYLDGTNKTVYASYSNPKTSTLKLVVDSADVTYSGMDDWTQVSDGYTKVVNYYDTITFNVPSRPGFVVDLSNISSCLSVGWGVESHTNTTITLRNMLVANTVTDASYTPVWVAGEYVVKFFKNAGELTTYDSQTINYGVTPSTVNLKTNSFTWASHNFKGWATSTSDASNGTLAFANGQALTNHLIVPQVQDNAFVPTEFNLYAAWTVNYVIDAAFNTVASPTQYIFGLTGGTVANANGQTTWELYPAQEQINVNKIAYATNSTENHYLFRGWFRKSSLTIDSSTGKVLSWGTAASVETNCVVSNVIDAGGAWVAKFELESFSVNVIKSPHEEYAEFVGSPQSNAQVPYQALYYYGATYTITFNTAYASGVEQTHFVNYSVDAPSSHSSGSAVVGNKNQYYVTVNSITQNTTITLNFIPVWNSQTFDVVVDTTVIFEYSALPLLPTTSQLIVRNKLINQVITSGFLVEGGENNEDVSYDANNNVIAGATANVRSENIATFYFEQNAYGVVLPEYIIPVSFEITPRTISKTGDFSIALTETSYTFDNSLKQPAFASVNYKGVAIPASTYTISYKNQDGTPLTVDAGDKYATITITTGNFTGSLDFVYSVARRSLTTLSDVNFDNIASFVYTSKELDPTKLSDAQLNIIDNGVAANAGQTFFQLQKDTHFTISSISGQNYINAGTPSFKISGVGNYKDEKTLTLTIVPFNLSSIGSGYLNSSVVATITSYTYDGTQHTPTLGNGISSIVLTMLTTDYPYKTAQNNVLFNYSLTSADIFGCAYANNVNASATDPTVTIQGQTNFEATSTFHFIIHKKNITVISFVQEGDEQSDYDGSYHAPRIKTDGLITEQDFTISYWWATDSTRKYNNNGIEIVQNTSPYLINFTTNIFLNAGIYTLQFYPTNRNYGYFDDQGNEILTPYSLTYTINQRATSNITISLNGTMITQPGQVVETVFSGSQQPFNIVVQDIINGRNIISADDYALLYDGSASLNDVDLVNVGTINIEFSPKANSSGANNYPDGYTLNFSFKINPKSWDNHVHLTLGTTSFLFDNTNQTPGVTVSVDDISNQLLKDRDFTVNFLNNKYVPQTSNVEDLPTVVITPKGNYTGAPVSETFSITKRSVILANRNILLFADLTDNAHTSYNATSQIPEFNLDDDGGIFNAINQNGHTNNLSTLSFNDLRITISKDGGAYTQLIPTTILQDAGIYTIKVEGINNYEGSYTLTYQITPVSLQALTYTYSGKNWANENISGTQADTKIYTSYPYSITNYIIQFDNGTSVDFSSQMFNLVYVQDGVQKTEAEIDWINVSSAPIEIQVSGKPNNTNFQGTVFETFKIEGVNLDREYISGVSLRSLIQPITNIEYTYSTEPSVVFAANANYASLIAQLNNNQNNCLDLQYFNTSTVGMAYVLATPKGNFSGNVIRLDFEIVPYVITSMSLVSVAGQPQNNNFVFNNAEQKWQVSGILFTDGQGTNVIIHSGQGANIEFEWHRLTGGLPTDFSSVGTFEVVGYINNTNFSGTVLYTTTPGLTATINYQIVQKQITQAFINWGSSVVYDGHNHTAAITVADSELANYDLVANGEVVLTNPTRVDAGSYLIAVTSANKNYASAYFEETFIINKKAFVGGDSGTIRIDMDSLVYNGTRQSPTFSVIDLAIEEDLANHASTLSKTSAQLVWGSDYVYYDDNTAYLSGELVNARGVATLTIRSEGNGNYESGVISKSFTIAPKFITEDSINVLLEDIPFTVLPDNKMVDPIATITDSAIVEEGNAKVLTAYNSSTGLGDYTIAVVIVASDPEYSPNGRDVGIVGVNIIGTNNYQGTIAGDKTNGIIFHILPVIIGDNYYIEFVLDKNTFEFNNQEQVPEVLDVRVKKWQNDHIIREEDPVAFTFMPSSEEIVAYFGNTKISTAQNFVYNAGTYQLRYEPLPTNNYQVQSGYTGAAVNYEITKASLTASMFFTNCGNTFVYNNSPQKATVQNEGNFNGYVLQKDVDFSVKFYRNGAEISNNADFVDAGRIDLVFTALSGSTNFTGSVSTINYTILPRSMALATAQIDGSINFIYTGNAVKPTVLVFDHDITNEQLLLDNDYEVHYYVSSTNNEEPWRVGTGYIIEIRGKNNYDNTTTLTLSFNIQKATFETLSLLYPTEEYTGLEHNAIVSSIGTNSGAVPSLTDYELLYKEVNNIDAANVSMIDVKAYYVFAKAKESSESFTGYAYTGFVITTAKIISVALPTEQQKAVYTSQNLNAANRLKSLAMVKTKSDVTLNPSFFNLLYYRDGVETTDFVNAGTIEIKVESLNSNFEVDESNPNTTTTFTILPKSIEATDGTIDLKFYYLDENGDPDLDEHGNFKYLTGNQVYQGREVAPVVTYYFNGATDTANFVTLVYGVDYTFDHEPQSWTDATQNGIRMMLTVTAISENYSGVKNHFYVITPAPWDDAHITVTIAPQVYTGSEITFGSDLYGTNVITAVYDKLDGSPLVNLEFGTHFVVATNYNQSGFENGYSNNIYATNGELSAMVVFRATDENYQADGVVLGRFVIQEYDINNIPFSFLGSSFTYDGNEHSPIIENLTFNSTPLVNNKDYHVTYNNSSVVPTNAGTYEMTVYGEDNFTGQKSFNFVINPKNLADSDILINLEENSTTYLANVPQKPIISSVAYGNLSLHENIDYSLSYTYTSFITNIPQSISGAASNFINAGSYVVTINALTSNPNFVNSKGKTYYINKDALSNIVLTPSSATYSGVAQTPTYTINAQNNNEISLTNIEISYQQYNSSEGIWENTNSPDFVNAGKVKFIATASNINANFAGTVSEEFTISPKQIERYLIEVDDSGLVYERNISQLATVVVLATSGGTPLVKDVDYTLNYTGDLIHFGNNTAFVSVVGINNYSCNETFTYSIAQKDINNIDLNLSVISNLEVEFTGADANISGLVAGILTHSSFNLNFGEDFTISYAQTERKNASTTPYSFSLVGMGNYKGELENAGLVFKVVPRDITNNSDIIVNLLDGDQYVYTGDDIEPQISLFDDGSNIVKREVSGFNYEVSYDGNRDVKWTDGTTVAYGAKVIVIGKDGSNYKGQKEIQFKILPINITSNSVVKKFNDVVLTPSATGEYNLPAQLYLDGDPVRPMPVLTFKNSIVPLEDGVYFNNTLKTEDSGEPAWVEIQPKMIGNVKNFVGTIRMYFTISTLNIEMAQLTFAGDVLFNGLPQKIMPTFVYDGRTLVEGQDYSLEHQNLSNDFTNVGEITILIDGEGEFAGHLVLSYRILPLPLTASTVEVSGLVSKEFTGLECTQNKSDLTLTVTFSDNRELTVPQGAFMLSYANNIDAGEAKVIFAMPEYLNNNTAYPKNNFAGTFEKTFEITPKALNANMFNIESEYAYTGENIEPNIVLTLTYDSEPYQKTYEKGLKTFSTAYFNQKDVKREYNSETNRYDVVENARVVISAVSGGNFSGEVTLTYKILPVHADANTFSHTLNLLPENIVYDGDPYLPTFATLQDAKNNVQTEDEDYRIIGYENNINASSTNSKALITVEFIKNYEGVINFEFSILPFNLENATATFNTLLGHVYNGESHDVEVSLSFINRNNQTITINDIEKEFVRTDGVVENLPLPVHAGEMNIHVTAGANFIGEINQPFKIEKLSINSITCVLEDDSYEFINKQITPRVVANFNGYELSEELGDFSVNYGENKHVADGGVIILAEQSNGNVKGVRTITFEIAARNLNLTDGISFDDEEFVYSGQAIVPNNIAIADTALTTALELENGVHYTLSFTAHVMPGWVTITATGKGDYNGEITKRYKILPRLFDDVTFEWIDSVDNLVFANQNYTPRFRLTYSKGSVQTVLDSTTDFTYEFKNNKNASVDAAQQNKPKVIITGINGYKSDVENNITNVITEYFEIAQYNITNLLQNKKLSNRKAQDGVSHQTAIFNEISELLIYNTVQLQMNVDYVCVVTGEGGVEPNYTDVGKLIFQINGLGNYTGSYTLEMNILSKMINNILVIINGEQSDQFGNINLTFNGIAYEISFVVRADNEVIPEAGYEISFETLDGTAVSQTDFLNAGTTVVKASGVGNYMGEAECKIIINPKSVNAVDIKMDNFIDSFVYLLGVKLEQNIGLSFEKPDGSTFVLTENDFDVQYYNNSYVGKACMLIIGKGNFKGVRSEFYYITKRASTVRPSVDNIVYYGGDALPKLKLRGDDTNGSISFDEQTTLQNGTCEYAWTFVPTDTSNMEVVHGTIQITAYQIVPERIDVFGDYKTNYTVFEKFNTDGLIVYLVYNNGKTQLLHSSQYTTNVQDGEELFLNTVPVVRYTEGETTVIKTLGISVSKIGLTIDFGDLSNIIQTEESQYITPTINNANENHAPTIITRYFSRAISAYTDGITQGGEYVISLSLVGNEYEFIGESTKTIKVKTGVLKSNDGRVVLIDSTGFEDGVRLTVREYSSYSQISNILDTRTISIKKCYEVQLWKDGKEYFPTHELTLRFNLGRNVLGTGTIVAYSIPSNADVYYENEYNTVDKDNVELKSRVLGVFAFGEKTESAQSVWWIALVGGLILVMIITSVIVVIVIKRRKAKMLSNGINIRLGRR